MMAGGAYAPHAMTHWILWNANSTEKKPLSAFNPFTRRQHRRTGAIPMRAFKQAMTGEA
jgi:hypothetical protein